MRLRRPFASLRGDRGALAIFLAAFLDILGVGWRTRARRYRKDSERQRDRAVPFEASRAKEEEKTKAK